MSPPSSAICWWTALPARRYDSGSRLPFASFKGRQSMASVNLRSLVSKLNPTCHRALEGAAGLCLSRSNYYVEIEHWLIKLMETADTDLMWILRHYDVETARVHRELTRALDQLRTGNARAPELSPRIVDLMRETWTMSSLEFEAAQIRSGYLLTTLLTEETLARRMRESSPELSKIPTERLQKEVQTVSAGSVEDKAESPRPEDAEKRDGRQRPPSSTPALDQFTLNLTERARKGEIDPVIGRDFEIRQVIDILTRRRQNNPILTGKAGVGKTAVVEGFALQVVAGDVPTPLTGVAVR